MIFISHANPEDNAVALWLATKVAAAGYPVWCDLINLLGGETFWDDIDDAIQNHAAKVILIMSRASNKPGVKDEIHCAIQTERRKQIRDFVIPCRIDDVPFDSNIQIARKTIVDFHSWSEGLSNVLQKLEKDGIQKNSQPTVQLLGAAWDNLFSASAGLSKKQSFYDTNRYPVVGMPDTIWANDSIAPDSDSFFPVTKSIFGGRRLSFQHRKPKATLFGHESEFQQPLNKPLQLLLSDGWEELGISSERARHAVVELLSKSWNRYLRTRGLEPYELSGSRPVFYFHLGNLAGGEVQTQLPSRRAATRNLWGELTVPKRDGSRESRFYHVAIEGRIDDDNGWHLMLLPHIVWTADALHQTFDKDDQHRFRRRLCKNWRNDRWRGFLYATVSWASEGKNLMEIPVGGNQYLTVTAEPLRLRSPVSHSKVQTFDIDDGEEDVEELSG